MTSSVFSILAKEHVPRGIPPALHCKTEARLHVTLFTDMAIPALTCLLTGHSTPAIAKDEHWQDTFTILSNVISELAYLTHTLGIHIYDHQRDMLRAEHPTQFLLPIL